MAEEMHEKCAVGAVYDVERNNRAAELVEGMLYATQHRGPEAAGIVSGLDDGSLAAHRQPGLVRDVFTDETMGHLRGNKATGHTKYSTSGDKKRHLQPVIDDALAFSFAHNGNIPTTTSMDSYLERHNLLHGEVNDSEKMSLTIAQHIREGASLPDAVEQAYPLFTGAFSCVASQDDLVVAFRDPYGIRPLALGKLDDKSWAVSSETYGLEYIGANYEREVEPGEMVIITNEGIESRQVAEGVPKLDIFEMVYFARHDSYLYNHNLYMFRADCGREMAEEHGPIFDDDENTLVVPIPDTSLPASEEYAYQLGLQHKGICLKNRYVVKRQFMETDDDNRQQVARNKHSIIREAVKGRNIILRDDSIVRMNTIPDRVKEMYAYGARKVGVLIDSPPVRFPDFYGIDTPTQAELAAANMTVEEMRKEIGCDYLGFLSLSRLIDATGHNAEEFNLSCFTGEYPIDIGERKKEVKKPVSMEYVD